MIKNIFTASIKRILCVSVACVISFGIVGCSNKAEPDGKTTNITKLHADDVDKSVDEKEIEESPHIIDTTEAEMTPENDSVEEKAEYLEVYLSGSSDQMWDNNINKIIASYRYPEIILGDADAEKYSALNASINRLNSVFRQARDNYPSLVDDARMMLDGFDGDYEYFMSFEDNTDAYIRRADDKVFSVCAYNSYYCGGAHGMFSYSGYNYDCETGEELNINQVVKDKERFVSAAEKEFFNNYSKDDIYDEVDLHEYISTYFDRLMWNLEYNGVTIYFSPYEIAPYAYGAQNVTVPFKGNEDLFEEKYQNAPDDYVVGMPPFCNSYFEDQSDKLSFVNLMYYSDEYDYIDSVTINTRGRSFTDDFLCFGINSYLAKVDGKNYLICQTSHENDYQVMRSYLISSDSIERKTECEGGLLCIFDDNVSKKLALCNPKSFVLENRTDLLGTVGAYRDYHINNFGELVTDDEYCTIAYDVKYTVLYDIKGKLVDEDGNVLDDYLIKKGTLVKYLRTDNSRWGDVVLGDGSIVRLYVNKDDWPYTVDGIDIEDAFDGLFFAG